jgi:glycosyltransferase involved in cell wall biosynthesis
MKILQLTASLGGGGAERIAVSLCNRFAANKDDEIVLVSILDDSVPENVFYIKDLSPKVRLINLHCNRGLQTKAIWGVYNIIKKERPDIVHSHDIPPLLLFPTLIIHKVCYMHTLHNMVQRIVDNSNIPIRIIMNYLFRCNKVKPITISKTCHQSYYNTYKQKNDICIVNGSEPLKITENFESVKEITEGLKNHSETTVFVHVARHHPQKNHDRLFSTFLRLEREGECFILIVLGEHYESWKTKLKDSKRIFLLGAKNNIGDYMAQADFFVLSSDYEGLPMSLIEAMSMGVVPISTPAGGVVDVIEDGITGYLTKTFDDEEFYLKVKQALYEKGKISSEVIKKHFEKYFSMETCAKNYYETYRSLINK